MTTIVLTVIGILLAAAAALMVVWYGGDAFADSRVKADAARLLVEGTQIEKAESLYRAQEGRRPSDADSSDPLKPLIDRRYIVKRPLGDTGRWFVDYRNRMIRADVGSSTDARAVDVCRAARRAQSLPEPRTVFKCDGSDYPYPHPAGTLPAAEPCCNWTSATASDAGAGFGENGG